MEISIKVQDSSTLATDDEFTINTSTLTITVAELITEKVRQEVERRNATIETSLKSVVKTADYERALNQKHRETIVKKIDFERECYVALEAFSKNYFFVFVNDKQYLHLEDSIPVQSMTEVLFLKITPLVGG